MADYGLRILNTAGTVQIDELYKNMEVRAVGTATTTMAYSGAASIAEIAYSGANPILVIRSANPATLYKQQVSGSSWTFYVVVLGATGQSVDYWIFDNPDNATPTGYGLAVYSASGDVIFNSNKKYLRVVDFFKGTGWSADNRTYVSGRVYGFATVFAGYGEQLITLSGGFYIRNEFAMSGSNITNGIRFEGALISSEVQAGSVTDGETYYRFGFMVVDLTDY